MSKIKNGNDYYQRIVDWIKKQEKGIVFRPTQVSKALSLDIGMVSVFLYRKNKKGYLDKKGAGKYVVVDCNAPIPLQIPKGKLPDLIFNLLRDLNLKFPKGYVREPMIVEKLKDQRISLNSVHNVMQRWFEGGYLISNNKIGKGYRIKDGHLNLKERPPVIIKK
ncbi:hypothetical protein COT98_02165 [Candidatus Falkowbacteria bacterium CG10_big_fil_rev_8_21_14_0_10_39_9]|uniref:Uncharacterized protein n=1 Tax=Candidatus Falkowbacteria bacterium CG10_big_fil_rev_8_21_14_0_10_39_9 TaxID=1974566 RepID=A0A2M6WPR6_9BACT|nr:MAG: hypothetical protein COT98_02165 [Candidatus Falkowbacteria bacterium CG10_big_fil_rev_8_21_14_0_10_39_9]